MTTTAGRMRSIRSRLRIGSSGWSYRDWRGLFYPAELPPSKWLSYYAERFDSVELNASFYRLPFENMIAGWNRRLPATFHLAAKGPRRITHLKKLRDVEEDLKPFLERIRRIRTLEVLLWQLPPMLSLDLDRLEAFLKLLPQGVRHAVEFRHPSWWCDETVRLLERCRAAFVAVSHPKLPDAILATGDFLYVRFHGTGPRLYAHDYSSRELSRWADRLRPLLRGRTLYAFFNNDWHAHALKNARRFRELLAAR